MAGPRPRFGSPELGKQAVLGAREIPTLERTTKAFRVGVPSVPHDLPGCLIPLEAFDENRLPNRVEQDPERRILFLKPPLQRSRRHVKRRGNRFDAGLAAREQDLDALAHRVDEVVGLERRMKTRGDTLELSVERRIAVREWKVPGRIVGKDGGQLA